MQSITEVMYKLKKNDISEIILKKMKKYTLSKRLSGFTNE